MLGAHQVPRRQRTKGKDEGRDEKGGDGSVRTEEERKWDEGPSGEADWVETLIVELFEHLCVFY